MSPAPTTRRLHRGLAAVESRYLRDLGRGGRGGPRETRARDQGVRRARPTPGETNLTARNSVPASAEPLEDVMEFLVGFDIR
jgi:hypothetical protein